MRVGRGALLGPLFLDEGQVGQALLPSHGFPSDSIEHVKRGDRLALVQARLEALTSGERKFMQERNVRQPVERTAASIADSDVDDEE